MPCALRGRYLDEEGRLKGQLPATPPFYQLALQSWRKLKGASTECAHPNAGARPAGVSELDTEPEANPGLSPAPGQAPPSSSLRLLVRAAMTPLGVFNDHLDYKALLRLMG